jgi:hypothetical protein
LDVANTVDQDTTNKRIGSASASFDGATATDLLSCPFADCGNELNRATTTTWGCWLRPTAETDAAVLTYAGAAGSLSYQLKREDAFDRVQCRVVEADTSVIQAFGPSTILANVWTHATCTFDDTANQLKGYRNASAGAASTATDMRSIASGSFFLGGDGSATVWAGQADDCYVYNGELIDADICRICSCGTTGGACSCWTEDPTIYLDTGFNSQCGGCTLPACNKAAPT